MSEPPMTEKTGVSMGLMMWLVGVTFAGAGSWTWLQAGQVSAEAQRAKQEARLDRIEARQAQQETEIGRRMRDLGVILCTTDDRVRMQTCADLNVLQ